MADIAGFNVETSIEYGTKDPTDLDSFILNFTGFGAQTVTGRTTYYGDGSYWAAVLLLFLLFLSGDGS